MKKTLLFACAFAATLSVSAQNDVIEVPFESNNYHQKYYAAGGDWYTTIAIGDYEFMFDIFGPEDGLVSGQTYTLADMDAEYSFGIDYSTYSQVVYTSVDYVETAIEEGAKNIDVVVVSAAGVTYHFAGSWAPSDEPEMITMPEGLETIDCVLTCDDFDYGPESFDGVKLAFDGDDVYLEGCGYVSYFFQSTIKGTREGNSLVFPACQCVGFGSTANYFIYGFDWDSYSLHEIVFTWDEGEAAYICESQIVVTAGMTDMLDSYYEFIDDVVLTPTTTVGIEQVTEQHELASKRLQDGKLVISAKGQKVDAMGLKLK